MIAEKLRSKGTGLEGYMDLSSLFVTHEFWEVKIQEVRPNADHRSILLMQLLDSGCVSSRYDLP